jgi:hypothetical protein
MPTDAFDRHIAPFADRPQPWPSVQERRLRGREPLASLAPVAVWEQLDRIGGKIGIPRTAHVEPDGAEKPDGGPTFAFTDQRWQKFIAGNRGKPEKYAPSLRKAARTPSDRAVTGELVSEPWLAVIGEPVGPYRLLNWDAVQVGVGMRATFRSAWQLRDTDARPVVSVFKTSQSYRTRRSSWIVRGPGNQPLAAIGGDVKTVRRDARRYRVREILADGQVIGAVAVRRAGIVRREALLEDPAGAALASVTFDKHDHAVLYIPGAIAEQMRLIALAALVIVHRGYGPESGG